MRFALVVPALNEEEAIAGTLGRALAARQKVIDETPVTEMKVVFVNDGSTDRTQEIVDRPEFDEVVKLRFVKNRGYGAAIKAGWGALDADLVGFIDADGTCDPDDCVRLINRLESTQADVVLAARLNPESQMPLIRKVGNVLFARLLGVVSGKKLTDCASGYRVVRRSSLRLISPLPDGLHFTPAMSAICLLDPRLRIEEVPTPYRERLGRSKLSVVKDGFRFLSVILFSACCYAPLKTMLAVALIWGLIAAALIQGLQWSGAGAEGSGGPLALAAALGAFLIVETGLICHQLNFLLIGPRRQVGALERLVQYVAEYRRMLVAGALTAAAGLAGLVGLGLRQTTPSPLATSLLVFALVAGAAVGLGGLIVRVIWAVGQKQKALLGEEYAVGPRPAGTGPETAIANGTVADPPAIGSPITGSPAGMRGL